MESVDASKTPPLVCVECACESDERAVGWKVYVSELEDETPAIGAYCRSCAEREFGR